MRFADSVLAIHVHTPNYSATKTGLGWGTNVGADAISQKNSGASKSSTASNLKIEVKHEKELLGLDFQMVPDVTLKLERPGVMIVNKPFGGSAHITIVKIGPGRSPGEVFWELSDGRVCMAPKKSGRCVIKWGPGRPSKLSICMT